MHTRVPSTTAAKFLVYNLQQELMNELWCCGLQRVVPLAKDVTLRVFFWFKSGVSRCYVSYGCIVGVKHWVRLPC